MTLEEIADRLYALPPEEFTAARTAEAKALDKTLAKQASALRKPTVGAWLVNTLAREEPDLLDQLLSLGPALAEAQRSGKGDALRELGEQRRQLIGAVTARAFEVAGREPSAAARAEVESTLEAALADPSSADAVRSGRLVRALSYAGFGEVDMTDAVAAPATARPTAKKAPPKKDVAAAEQRALEAAGALDDAVRACERAHQDQDDAEAAHQEAAEEVDRLEQALHDARERGTAAEDAARKAARRSAKAEQAVKDAQAAAEKARKALDRLRRS